MAARGVLPSASVRMAVAIVSVSLRVAWARAALSVQMRVNALVLMVPRLPVAGKSAAVCGAQRLHDFTKPVHGQPDDYCRRERQSHTGIGDFGPAAESHIG